MSLTIIGDLILPIIRQATNLISRTRQAEGQSNSSPMISLDPLRCFECCKKALPTGWLKHVISVKAREEPFALRLTGCVQDWWHCKRSWIAMLLSAQQDASGLILGSRMCYLTYKTVCRCICNHTLSSFKMFRWLAVGPLRNEERLDEVEE
jgi:hypothetical protein